MEHEIEKAIAFGSGDAVPTNCRRLTKESEADDGKECSAGHEKPACDERHDEQGGRFFVVDVELAPCAFRHAAITMRETFWPESVSREVKRK